jgi:hypothetical protein
MPPLEATLNYLGIPIIETEIDMVLQPEINPNIQPAIRNYLDNFFGIKSASLTREILSRYVKASSDDLHVSIMPHDEQHLIGNILTPHKSAKKCYCFGDYLAVIELSAHLAEMLTSLLYLMTPISINGTELNEDAQKDMFGRKFIKLNQNYCLNILKTFNIIDITAHQHFNEIRLIRNNHFHLFGHSKENLEEDAFNCYSKITSLIKDILEIKINNTSSVTYTINPKLKNFLNKKQSQSN